MVPTFKSKTLITDLYSMNPPDSNGILLFYHPTYSQSKGDIWHPFLPEPRSYGSGSSGNAWIEVEFRDPIWISGITIQSEGICQPKSSDIIIDDQVVLSERASDLNDRFKLCTFGFWAVLGRRVRVRSTGPSWDEKPLFNINQMQLLSLDHQYFNGVIETLAAEHPGLEIRKHVNVTARDFDPSTVHDLNQQCFICTFNGPQQWFQIALLNCQLLSTNY
jgi:hypothetical protein